MTASKRIREARSAKNAETRECPFCNSTRAAKFEGSNVCADQRACIKRIGK